jgi:hypothetical protein
MQKLLRANKIAKVKFEEHKEGMKTNDLVQSSVLPSFLRSVSSSSILVLPKKAVDTAKRRHGVLVADLTENQ